jgi:hypothetical protein
LTTTSGLETIREQAVRNIRQERDSIFTNKLPKINEADPAWDPPTIAQPL